MNSIFYQEGFAVPPMSCEKIENMTKIIRLANPNHINENGAIDVLALLELEYGKYRIVPDEELPGILGLTLPTGEILLRESIYDGAFDGNGRARFTIAHELAHALMHKKYIGLARPVERTTKIYCNAEWQANEFAGRLLLPTDSLLDNRNLSVSELAENFGVSLECAQTRRNKLNRNR